DLMEDALMSYDFFNGTMENKLFKPVFNITSPDPNRIYRHPILYAVAIYAASLVIIGTIGNLLTIFILIRPNLRCHTTMRYLIAAAVSDLCTLYSWNLNLFYKHMINPYQNDMEDLSLCTCRLISFLAFTSLQLSSWYLMIVSFDRAMNIYFLFWKKGLGKPHNATYIIFVVAICIILLNSHLLFLNGFVDRTCTPYGKQTCIVCYKRLIDYRYVFPKWEKVHLILYNLIPFTIMSMCNVFIIYRTLTATKRLSKRQTNSHNASTKNRIRKQRQLTTMLILVTFLFIILTMPAMIYHVFLRHLFEKKKPLKYILQGILLCIQFTSHAINFFVYCFTASNFRDEMRKLFRLHRKGQQHKHALMDE
ncbi:unnamed protein product, partial [Didymodactylos carnosus]